VCARALSPKFDEKQRDELVRRGLCAEQIAAIEEILPTAAALIEQPARMGHVRERLTELSTQIAASCQAVTNLLDAGRSTLPDSREALFWAQIADFNLHRNTDTRTLHNAVAALNLARTVIDRAITELPREQRRSRQASPAAVALIDRALLDGLVKAGAVRDMLKRSSSPGSAYRDIIGICYQAMGQSTHDPERAIRAFIALKKSQNAQAREHPVVTSGTRGGRRK
jgi:hypothetical protein